jgi:DNA modification methylase
MTTEPARRRRSLTHVGGEIAVQGDASEAAALAAAIDVDPDDAGDAPDRAHVHGFHAYPARAHPVTARRLVESFAPAGGVVLDPFCGSGTVIVEAMLAGRDAIGTDLNPLAVALARAKTFARPKERSEALVASAREVAAFADARRKAKAGATRRLAPEDLQLFTPHVVLELDSLRAGIGKAPPEHRPELGLVLSSILVKVSQKKGDTSTETIEKRIAAGYPAKLFVKKTMELAERFEVFSELLAPVGAERRVRARIHQDDATKLVNVKTASIDTVITSPPYVATYDYLEHHELRLRWLSMDATSLADGEIGSRRHYAGATPDEAREEWSRELGLFFDALARVTKPGGNIVLLMADSAAAPPKGRRGATGGSPQALRADEIVADVADVSGKLIPVACASQPRPHFHGPSAAAFETQPRAEHAILLRRATGR